MSDIKSIFNGSIITREIKDRFYKSISILGVSVKDTTIRIQKSPSKELVNNIYYPINLESHINDTISGKIQYYLTKMARLLKRFRDQD